MQIDYIITKVGGFHDDDDDDDLTTERPNIYPFHRLIGGTRPEIPFDF